MQLATRTSTYEFSLDAYHKRTPEILKYIADGILSLALVLNTIFLSAPDFEKKALCIFITGTVATLFKWITKFVTEFPNAPKVDAQDANIPLEDMPLPSGPPEDDDINI